MPKPTKITKKGGMQLQMTWQQTDRNALTYMIPLAPPHTPKPTENPQESSQVMDYGATRSTGSTSKPLAIPLDHAGMRQVRSSMNLERMLIPVNAISRTPPARRGAGPLRPSPNGSAGGGGGGGKPPTRSSLSPVTDRSNSGGAIGPGPSRARLGQKPVLVSYMPQTLHNAVAGDLSSTSNLSAKFTSDSKKAAAARRALL